MEESTIDDEFLAIIPLFVLLDPSSITNDSSKSSFSCGVAETENEELSLPVFTDYDRAYDYMAASFLDWPELAVVTCADKRSFRHLVTTAKTSCLGIASIVFDPLPTSGAMSTLWDIDKVIEATRGGEEDGDSEAETNDGETPKYFFGGTPKGRAFLRDRRDHRCCWWRASVCSKAHGQATRFSPANLAGLFRAREPDVER